MSKQYIYKQWFIYKSFVWWTHYYVPSLLKSYRREWDFESDDQLIIYIELHSSVEHSMLYWVDTLDLVSKKSSILFPAVYLRSAVLLLSSILLLFPVIGEMVSNFLRPKLGVVTVVLRTTTGFLSLKWSCTGELLAVW